MAKGLMKKIGIGMATLGTMINAANADNKISGDIGYVATNDKNTSYVEANVFYGLPLGVKGYSYLDFYNGEGGYYGETQLSRPLCAGFGPKVEVVHAGELFTHAEVGAQYDFQKLPSGTWASLKLLPAVFNDEGHVNNKVILGGAAGVDLPHNFGFGLFGEINLAAKDGPEWMYGEAEIFKKLGDVCKVGYRAAMLNQGKGEAAPKIENGLAIRVKF